MLVFRFSPLSLSPDLYQITFGSTSFVEKFQPETMIYVSVNEGGTNLLDNHTIKENNFEPFFEQNRYTYNPSNDRGGGRYMWKIQVGP